MWAVAWIWWLRPEFRRQKTGLGNPAKAYCCRNLLSQLRGSMTGYYGVGTATRREGNPSCDPAQSHGTSWEVMCDVPRAQCGSLNDLSAAAQVLLDSSEELTANNCALGIGRFATTSSVELQANSWRDPRS